MKIQDAIQNECRKYGLCSCGCPLCQEHDPNHRYLCNELDSQKLIDKLTELGYNIDGAFISIEETEYWRTYES